jgi:hypothetical protein
MNTAVLRIMASIALVFVCSCATEKAYTHEDRNYPTGINADEGVVILLNTSRSNEKSVESESEEKSLEDCVRTEMMKVNPRLRSVSAKEFRHMVFPDKGFLDSPRSPKDLLFFLRDPYAQSRVMGLGVRYLIVVTATTSERKADWKFEARESVLGVHRDWYEDSSRDADVLDVKYLRESGRVRAACFGKGFCVAGCGGGGQGCLIPFAWSHFPSTEPKACAALGEGVIKFIIDGHDMVPTTQSGTGVDNGGRGSDIQTRPEPASEEDGPKGTFD